MTSHLRRVVALPELSEQVANGDEGGVKDYEHRFGVAGAAAADLCSWPMGDVPSQMVRECAQEVITAIFETEVQTPTTLPIHNNFTHPSQLCPSTTTYGRSD